MRMLPMLLPKLQEARPGSGRGCISLFQCPKCTGEIANHTCKKPSLPYSLLPPVCARFLSPGAPPCFPSARHHLQGNHSVPLEVS